MSRFTESRGKLSRRFGVNLFGNAKFDRLLSRNTNTPGQHGSAPGRRKVSEYGTQLLEKQKLKYAYGLRERQFRVAFHMALRRTGITGDNLMITLETRLDNVVYRLGFARTREGARQLVGHGHVKVNGRRVNIPSFAVGEGDVITLKDSPRSQNLVKRTLEETLGNPVPAWLAVDRDTPAGQVVRLPMRDEIPTIANEKLVVELYSK